jgi:hypothetical protein
LNGDTRAQDSAKEGLADVLGTSRILVRDTLRAQLP